MSAHRPLQRCAWLLAIVGPVCAWAQTLPPTVSSIAFAPSLVPSGGLSQLIIDFGNPNSTPATLDQILSDPLPAGLQLTGAASTGTCASGSVIAPTGAGSVSYAQGGSIPTGGCTIDVPVKAPGVAATDYYTDAVPAGSLQTNLGSNPSPASATLAVQNDPLTTVPAQLTPAQNSVGNAIANMCAALQSSKTLTVAQQHLLSTCNAVIGTYGNGGNAANLPGLLNALSGRQVAAQQITAIDFSGAQFANLGQRLAQVRAGLTGGLSLSGLGLVVPTMPTTAAIPAALMGLEQLLGIKDQRQGGAFPGGSSGDDEGLGGFSSRLGLFVNGNLRSGTDDSTLDMTGFDFSSDGITAGADYRLTNDLVLGVAYGHSNGWTDFVGDNGHIHSASNTASVYGSVYRGPLYVDFIGTYGHNSYREARTSTFSIDSSATQPSGCFGGECTIETTGSTGAAQFAAATNIGYTMHKGGFQFGPEISLNYTRVDVDAFTEQDPTQSGLALAFGSEAGDSLLAKLGGNVSYAIDTPIGVILPEARVHYLHEFRNDQRTYTVHFADDPDIGTPTGPASNFVVYTDEPARNYLEWAAGVTAQFPFGFAGFVEYGSVARESYIHTRELSAGLRFQRPF